MSNALSTYKIPDIYSVPKKVEIIALETQGDAMAIYRSKAVGEPPLMYGIGAYFSILDAMEAANKTKDFEIVSISVDKPKNYKRWQEAIIHDKSTWTQVLDSTKTYPLKYGITGYPTLMLIDPDGNGIIRIIGYHEEGALRRILEKYVRM